MEGVFPGEQKPRKLQEEHPSPISSHLKQRINMEKYWKSDAGRHQRKVISDHMKKHGASLRLLRKDVGRKESMAKKFIIGLCGRGGSGKSTFAQEIIKQASISFTSVNFKDALVELAKDIGWNGIKDDKGRKFLQILATEAIRDCIDEHYWCDRWHQRAYRQIRHRDKSVVVDDIRFNNEAEEIVKMGEHYGCQTFIVKLVTPDQKEVMTEEAKSHVSELGISESLIDSTIIMDFGLDHIACAAKNLLNQLKLLKEGDL